ncbi:HAD family hydrolase [Weissella cibaria]|uniref:HAD family hydrolase n=1 Tax=Weissella cibaria TaxID=137591 RepID=UPI001FF38443|nr:HAD family hydrolase [Weissella cibaria]UOX37796.1 HAD family hydrolase [Weissella cibaria]
MKSFIFDVDGTLLSTESMYMKSLQQTLEENGIHKAYEELYAIFGLPSLDALIKFGIENPEEMQRQWQDHYHDFWDMVQLFAGVTDMLADLKATGVQLGIVTSNTPEEFADHADAFGINGYFDDFVFAGQTPKMKPAADPILKSMADLKATPETSIYIGDSVHDMHAAHNAGIKFGMAAWGVRDRAVFNDEAEFIFETPADILKLVD